MSKINNININNRLNTQRPPTRTSMQAANELKRSITLNKGYNSSLDSAYQSRYESDIIRVSAVLGDQILAKGSLQTLDLAKLSDHLMRFSKLFPKDHASQLFFQEYVIPHFENLKNLMEGSQLVLNVNHILIAGQEEDSIMKDAHFPYLLKSEVISVNKNEGTLLKSPFGLIKINNDLNLPVTSKLYYYIQSLNNEYGKALMAYQDFIKALKSFSENLKIINKISNPQDNYSIKKVEDPILSNESASLLKDFSVISKYIGIAYSSQILTYIPYIMPGKNLSFYIDRENKDSFHLELKETPYGYIYIEGNFSLLQETKFFNLFIKHIEEVPIAFKENIKSLFEANKKKYKIKGELRFEKVNDFPTHLQGLGDKNQYI